MIPQRTRGLLGPIVAAFFVVSALPLPAAEMAAEDAWKALPTYQAGQDMAALLAIDREVIGAMASPQARAACAARLAALLESADTTPAARQYICLQLRQAGTPAQVPLLARLLAKPEMSEIARQTLQAIPGEESLAALRDSLGSLHGSLLIGAINSLAVRRDSRCIAKLEELAGDKDAQVAAAAMWALGTIASDQAAAVLIARAEKSPLPTPPGLAVPLLRCADAMSAAGSAEKARALYTKLSQAGQSTGIRRAALESLLRLEKAPSQATVFAWLSDADPDRRLVAAGRLASLTEKQLDQLADQLDRLPDASKPGLLEVLAPRMGQKAMPMVLAAAQSDKAEMKRAGMRGLGLLGDSSAIPLLIDGLAAGKEVTEAAEQSLTRMPRETVGPAVLKALQDRPEIRTAVIDVLKRLRYYEAIDPLIELAAQDDPAVFEPALDGLKGIADPDEHDIPRLIRLLLKTSHGKQRDEVERVIAVVCEKQPAGADRAQPVLAALAKLDRSQSRLKDYLPLLARFGGAETLKKIEAGMAGSDAGLRQAAVRALCNWPNADVAGKLWELAQSDNRESRTLALRAYVRVVTLKSSRPEAETLAMLKQAMKRAASAEERQWVLTRASTVRTLETVAWIAPYLDDPEVTQAACLAIVELAHHRFLRHPNMDRFGPLLDKVSRICKDPALVERAKKYRLGL